MDINNEIDENKLKLYPFDNYQKIIEIYENDENKKILKKIRDIFYNNLSQSEKKEFINNVNEDFEHGHFELYKFFNNEECIKNRVIFSQIKTLDRDFKEEFEIIIIIPSDNENVQKHVTNYMKENLINKFKVKFKSPKKIAYVDKFISNYDI